MLGHNIFDTDNDTSTNDDDDDGGFLDSLSGKWDEIKDDVKDKINDITSDIADELADTLGIAEWYSIHVMDACEGYYKPNATSPGAGLNISDCTQSPPDSKKHPGRGITLVYGKLTVRCYRALQLEQDAQP